MVSHVDKSKRGSSRWPRSLHRACLDCSVRRGPVISCGPPPPCHWLAVVCSLFAERFAVTAFVPSPLEAAKPATVDCSKPPCSKHLPSTEPFCLETRSDAPLRPLGAAARPPEPPSVEREIPAPPGRAVVAMSRSRSRSKSGAKSKSKSGARSKSKSGARSKSKSGARSRSGAII